MTEKSPPALSALVAPDDRVAAVACFDLRLDVHVYSLVPAVDEFMSLDYSSPQIISCRTLATSPPVCSVLRIPRRPTIAFSHGFGGERIDQHTLRTAGS